MLLKEIGRRLALMETMLERRREEIYADTKGSKPETVQ